MSSILEEGHINIIINALRQGITNLNDLTNKVFFAKNPKLDPKMPLKQEQTTEVRQWVAISAPIKNLIQLIKVDPHFPVPYTGPRGYYVNIINIVMDSLRQGNRVNDLADKVFFAKHPDLNPKTPLKQEQTTLVREWVGTKALLNALMPSIKIVPSTPTSAGTSTTPSSPVGPPEPRAAKAEKAQFSKKEWTDRGS